MYERIGADGRRPSPFSWRIRYALAHKGVPVEFRHVRFADVETIRALSGQHFVPVVTDGDRVIHDSWNIACHLEDRFPERPSLFAGSGGRGLARLVNHWSATVLGTAAMTGALLPLRAAEPGLMTLIEQIAAGVVIYAFCVFVFDTAGLRRILIARLGPVVARLRTS